MRFLNVRNCCRCPPLTIKWDPSPFNQSNRHNNSRFSIDISLKNIFTRTAAWIFCDEIVQSAQLFSKYYTWNLKALISISIIATNVFLGSMVPIFQQALREFINNAIKNSNEFNLYIYSLIYLLSIIFSISTAHALNGVLCKKLRDDLAYEMREELLKSWSETNAWNTYQNTASGSKIKNPEVDITVMATALCRHLVDLINARISTLSLFIGALRSMYLNSGFLTLSFLGLQIELPYLILVCFLYVSVFSKASSWTNAIFKKNTEDEQETINILIKNKSIQYEQDNKSIHNINKRSLLPQFGLSFLNKINSDLSMLIGASTLLASGNIDGIIIAYMAQNFSIAAVLASWHRTQLENIKKLGVALERTLCVLAVPNELHSQDDVTLIVD